MHVADFSIGMLGANGIVGGGFGIATGAALAIKYQGRGEVAVCFFGDGATNKGTFHESLNFAGRARSCRSCSSARTTGTRSSRRHRRTTRVTDISVRAASYGIAGDSIDGNDVARRASSRPAVPIARARERWRRRR